MINVGIDKQKGMYIRDYLLKKGKPYKSMHNRWQYTTKFSSEFTQSSFIAELQNSLS